MTGAVHKHLNFGGTVTLASFRHQMELGERRPMWLPDGTYNSSPVTGDESRRDTFAWAAIREGLRVKLFTTGVDAVDGQLLGCEVDEPLAQEYLSIGGDGKVICPYEGPLIPDYSSVSGFGRDPKYYYAMIERSKVRRPSRGFVEAFAAFCEPLDDEQRQLQALPVADFQVLIEYLAHGTRQDPDEWGRMHQSRLVPVDWSIFASALAAAGVPQKGKFFGPSYKTMLGRWKSEEIHSWIVSAHPRERWNGTFEEVSLQLLRDGSLVDGSGAKTQSGSGNVSPERMREVAIRNKN